MKWFKHISDSLDDPFIFSLMEEFGSDGYVVFFGIIEIYSREFLTQDGWKLTEKISFFRHKLLISSARFKLILSKIYKWEVSYSGEYVSIYIPKYKELLDESTLKKLRGYEKSFRNHSGTIPKTEATDKDKDKEPPIAPHKKQGAVYVDDFLIFWGEYPRKVGKDAAYRAWKARNGTRPEVADLVTAIRKQTQSDQWQKENGQFIPNPSTWINQGRWADEVETLKPKGSW